MSKRLTPAQIVQAAMSRKLEPAVVRAVLAVESSGEGFLPDGRPKVLFERHWLWRQLMARGINPKPIAASRPDLCGPKWERRYYHGGAGEYARIEAVVEWASKHAPAQWESYKKAAYEATSWGLGQVMGFHYKRLSYPDVYALKHAAEESEANQLEMMLRFVETGGLLDELRRHDWIGFTRAYNGTGQVPVYSARLVVAYAREKKRG